MVSPTMQCSLCNSTHTELFFSLSNVSVANNVLCKTYDEAMTFPVGNLRFIFCLECNYAWNMDFEPHLLEYNANYENNQSFSNIFLNHIDTVIERFPSSLFPLKLLEIGCGQGYFLERIAYKYPSILNYAVGFDPALKVCKATKAYMLLQGLLDPKALPSGFEPNLTILRHVVEHIANPVPFFNTICSQIPKTQTYAIETPNLLWILVNNAYFDMYYEHCSLFTPSSIECLLQKFGFDEFNTEILFGGQYMLSFANKGLTLHDDKRERIEYSKIVRQFADNFYYYREKWANFISSSQNNNKKVAVWGAASKGVMFLQHMKDMGINIEYVIDININKQDCYVPCTGAKIIKPELIKKYNINTVIVANPLYKDEISNYCKKLCLHVNIITLE